MIKKLRRRFTLISIGMTGSVIALLFSIVYLFFAVYGYNSIEANLRTYAMSPEQASRENNDLSNSRPMLSNYSTACIVSVDNYGKINILSESTANMSDNMLTEAVIRALEKDDGFGIQGSSMLFFYRYTDPASTNIRIAFTNAAIFYNDLQGVLVLMIILFAVIMVMLWLITRFTVKLSLTPVQRTWEQQQNFIGDASHELKTPLTVILTNMNILLAHKKETVEEQLSWVNSTLEESNHMKDLVEKLLILAKSDDLSHKDMFEPVNLSDLTLRLSLQYEPIAFEKGVTLKTEIEDGIIINGEFTALNQIVHILLDNAIKYAGIAGCVSLSVSKNKKNILLSCNNTGEPIPKEDLPHIFERFYRSDKVRTTAENSYGLGLAICRNLVDVHKGEISCTSTKQDGTTFNVIFNGSGVKKKINIYKKPSN